MKNKFLCDNNVFQTKFYRCCLIFCLLDCVGKGRLGARYGLVFAVTQWCSTLAHHCSVCTCVFEFQQSHCVHANTVVCIEGREGQIGFPQLLSGALGSLRPVWTRV